MAIELPALVQKLVLDTSGFTSGTRAAEAAFSSTSRSADTHAKKTSTSWLKASQGLSDLGRASLGFGAALTAGFAASVAAAAGFEREMRNVASISKTVQGDFDRISDQVVALSRTVPQSAKTLAAGLYDIVSSGADGAEAMVVLEASAKAASAGLTSTAVAAKGVSAVLNAYGKTGFEAAEVTDILFQTVNKGVITFEELSQNLGDFVGTAAVLKVPIEDAAAALATMTLSGISAAEAATALNRVFISFIDPSEAMTATLRAQGYESGSAAIKALGLKGAIELLGQVTGGSAEAMRELFPEVRGLKGALALLANEGENYNEVAAAITDETQRLGATQRAYNEQAKSFTFQLELAKNNVAALGIEIGQTLLPVLSGILGAITGAVNAFHDLPGPMRTVLTVLGLVTAAAALLGGTFLLLAPRILAVRELFVGLTTRAPALAGALGTLSKAFGVIGIALTVITAGMALYGRQQAEARKLTEDFRTAIEREKLGLEGATDATIQAKVVQEGLAGSAAKLGVSYEDLTAAIRGTGDVTKATAGVNREIVTSLSNQLGTVGKLTDAYSVGKTETEDFAGKVERLRGAFAAAQQKVKEQEEQTGLLMAITGKTKKELVELGLAAETSGDKIAEAAASIGLTTNVLAQWGITSEDSAEAFAKAIQGAMDATAKAFLSDFDLVAKFSASSWEKMVADAESGSDRITKAEEKLQDAREAQLELQERLAEKTELSVSDHQQLARAEEKVAEAAQAVAKAHAEGASSLGTMGEEIAKFYSESIVEAKAFTDGISKAIQAGLDPNVVTRLLQAGPKEAAPLLQQIVGDHGSTLVQLINESEAALAKTSTIAIETARLTQLAVSSRSGKMVTDLKTAVRIAQLEAESGGRLTIHALAAAMDLEYRKVKEIVDNFGLEVAPELTAAAQKGAAGFAAGIGPMAPSAEAVVRAVDSNFKNVVGPLPPWVSDRAKEIASSWKLGVDDMPEDTRAVMYLLDSHTRNTLAPLPGFTDKTVNQLAAFWRTGLDPMPGDTDRRARETASRLQEALDPLPEHTRRTAESSVVNWLRELAKGEDGTSEQTAAWARALLGILNPLLEGVGAVPVQLDQTEGGRVAGVSQFAAGGIEDHRAQIAPAGSWRLWAEPETGGEAYIPLAPQKRPRSTEILDRVAGMFGYGLTPMAFGGVVDDLGIPINPTLGEYGHLVGYTAEKQGDNAYNAVRKWVEENRRRMEAAAAATGAAGGGEPYTGGEIGSGWRQITGYLDSKGVGYTITSTDRPGDPGFHGRGKAVDMVGGGGHSMADIFHTLAAGDPVPGINELFYDPIGYFYDEGRKASGAIGGHDDHVHAATFDWGGILYPGWNAIYNGTGAMEALSPTAMAGGGFVPDLSSSPAWRAPGVAPGGLDAAASTSSPAGYGGGVSAQDMEAVAAAAARAAVEAMTARPLRATVSVNAIQDASYQNGWERR